MDVPHNRSRRFALGVAVLASTTLLAVGFAFAARDFGSRAAAVFAMLLAPPLVVAVRLRRRWPTVRGRELAYLAVLFGAAAGGSLFLVRAWYADGLDRDHAEDVRWAAFERQLRQDPAFRDVRVHKLERRTFHWASGTVDSEADLTRLRSLAAGCGIVGPLDGPLAHDVSLTVRGQPGS